MFNTTGKLIEKKELQKEPRFDRNGDPIIWRKCQFKISVPYQSGLYTLTFYTTGMRTRFLDKVNVGDIVNVSFTPYTSFSTDANMEITENYASFISLFGSREPQDDFLEYDDFNNGNFFPKA